MNVSGWVICLLVCALIGVRGARQIQSFNVSSSYDTRVLQHENEKKLSYHEKKSKIKSTKLASLVGKIEKVPSPTNFRPDEGYAAHNPSSPHVVFAAAMSTTLMRRDVNMFCKTLRKTGFTGDIVIGISPGSMQPFLDALKQNNAVVYTVITECKAGKGGEVCNFPGQEEQFSINMIRFHLYTWWAQLYGKESIIMLSDFRDVFFQSNPFAYKPYQWSPPDFQLVVFQEAHPNKVIKRCPFNSGWIRSCYGEEALKLVGSNTVSCSGVTIGSRDGILAYTYLMTQQLNPSIRGAGDAGNNKCSSTGMDQGFHNWLLYSGVLEKYMEVKYFQQGEGPVNTVGAFKAGPNALLKWSLEEWGILKGEAPEAYISNWNGDKSPAVHQLDRFLGTSSIGSHYTQKLEAAQNLG